MIVSLPFEAISIPRPLRIFNSRGRDHINRMSAVDGRPAYRTKWKQVVVVCRKCGKRQRGGFGPKGREKLKSLLRSALRDSGRRREVRVFETSCLGICPKHGVIALNASRPETLHVIAAGTDAQSALRTLLGDDTVTPRGGVEPTGLALP